MRARAATLLVCALAFPGCGRGAGQDRAVPATPQQPVETRPVTPAFAGRTWRVTESASVARGTRYEFRPDGVLRITGPGSTPSEGTWTWHEGVLTMVEDGIPYRIDILALDDHTFRIRSNNPGAPVEITLVREP